MATHREGNRREMATHRGEEVERRWLHVERKDEKRRWPHVERAESE